MIRVPIRSIFSGCLDGGLDASEKWILVHVHEIFELAHVLHVLRLASLLWGLGLRMQDLGLIFPCRVVFQPRVAKLWLGAPRSA